MLLENIGFVVKIVSISGRTTGDVHAVGSCYAPTIIQAYNTPSFYLPSSDSSVCQLSAIQTTAFSDGNATAPPRSF